MAVNKIIYNGETLVDLTSDTVTADDLAAGVTATGADGKPVVGLLPKVTIDTELSATSTNPVQNKTITAALSNLDIDIATNDEIDNALNVAGSGDLPTTGGIVPIAMGGTGATTTAGARTNLGVSATADFANVAFSGAYDDLTGKPAIPSRISDLANNSGYITSSALSGYVKSVNGAAPVCPSCVSSGKHDNRAGRCGYQRQLLGPYRYAGQRHDICRGADECCGQGQAGQCRR